MRLNLGTGFLVATIVIAFSACAQSKKGAGTSGKNVKLVEATRQEILPGVPGGDIQVTYRFVIVWQSAAKPESFFWRGEDGWMNCAVSKIHRKPGHSPADKDADLWYSAETISLANIKKGDSLELLPVTGGRFPIPEEIPATAKNTIFYKTITKTNWLSIPVKSIKDKPSIAMP